MISVEQLRMRPDGALLGTAPALTGAQLVLAFGTGDTMAADGYLRACSDRFPGAIVVGCSTAGTIAGPASFDDELAVTALRFDHTQVRVATASTAAGAHQAGAAIARQLADPALVHVLVLSEGINVNGTELVRGLVAGVAPSVTVTGGLAGDGDRMEKTLVIADGAARRDHVVAVGFYGDRLHIGHGCMGGWGPFGPEREITRADGNVLYELDGQPALGLYKRYLGAHAEGLPATGLLFPLEIRPPDGGPAVVRTILGIDETSGSLRFAGDMPTGHYARLMTASFGRLIEGAHGAAEQTLQPGGPRPDLALLVSCVGRRLLLRQRSDEELERVRDALGGAPTTGFYSYGELCPTGQIGCELHNQTMTITTLSET